MSFAEEFLRRRYLRTDRVEASWREFERRMQMKWDVLQATERDAEYDERCRRVAKQMDAMMASYDERVAVMLWGNPDFSQPAASECEAQTCECGSGSNERSGAHSHWCRLWLAP